MLSLAACSQEDIYPSAESGNAVRIGSVSIGSKVETRVSENPDDGGKSSLWDFDGTERIAVQVSGGVQGTYTLTNANTVTATSPTYWTGRQAIWPTPSLPPPRELTLMLSRSISATVSPNCACV